MIDFGMRLGQLLSWGRLRVHHAGIQASGIQASGIQASGIQASGIQPQAGVPPRVIISRLAWGRGNYEPAGEWSLAAMGKLGRHRAIS
ncbi:hypothetical protein BK140_27465 [Paenibacillus macerans]|nr:hypothetical protein BK140_27465 [Paenibacillus macerans]